MKTINNTMLSGKFVPLFFKMSVPGIVGMLVTALYNLCDAIFVGQLIGKEALGAISIAFPFTMINTGIGMLIGIGSASVLSRALGANDRATIQKILGNLIASVFILSTAVTITGLIFTEWLLGLTGAEGAVFEYAVDYLRIIFVGSFFINFSFSANMLIRGEGKVKLAMIIMAGGAVLNIILNPIFMVLLKMGVNGAAVATVVTQFLQAGVTFLHFRKGRSEVPLNKPALSRELLPGILSVGISGMLTQTLNFVQQVVIFKVLSLYNCGGLSVNNSDLQILMGVCLRIIMFSMIAIFGMTHGLQPLIGMNYGARKFERVKGFMRVFYVGAFIAGIVFWLLSMAVPGFVLSLFMKDRHLIGEGIPLLRTVMILFPLVGPIFMTVTFFQAIGKGLPALVFVCLRTIVIFIPMMLLLSNVFGVRGVWMGMPATDLLVFLAGFLTLKVEFGKMIKKENEKIYQPV